VASRPSLHYKEDSGAFYTSLANYALHLAGYHLYLHGY
jgi:hypothetical protein